MPLRGTNDHENVAARLFSEQRWRPRWPERRLQGGRNSLSPLTVRRRLNPIKLGVRPARRHQCLVGPHLADPGAV